LIQNHSRRSTISEDISSFDYTTIIAVRHSDPYLEEAILSVLRQTLPPARILVVINGTLDSSCSSMALVKSFGGPVEGFLLEESGLVPALNAGLSMLATPYVAFLDSDDIWVETKQENQITLLNSETNIDAVSGVVANFRDKLDGERQFLKSAQASLLGAVTFRSDSFAVFGGFDPASTHYSYLYRWYSQAYGRGLKIFRLDGISLLRRIHSNNGWVREREHGFSELHSELRRIAHGKRESASK
jgi:glycosyltransferase involved in cell wall biosynthesis